VESTGRRVRDSPASFLFGQRRNEVSIDHTLNLMRRASGNIQYRPACLLANAILRGRKKGKQSRECTGSNDRRGPSISYWNIDFEPTSQTS
jgi:hypothetical protein